MTDKVRIRNINVEMYFDEKFMELTPLKPSGQALFIYLLTCPFNKSIPGIYRVGKAALADEIGWSLEDFEKSFNELQKAKMVKADWKNKLVFIPSMLKYHKPYAPNTIIGWKSEWDSLQNCALKKEAYELFKSFCKESGKSLPAVFSRSISEPIYKQK